MKFKVGDKVKIILADDTPWGKRTGQIGRIGKVGNEDVDVLFEDGESWWYLNAQVRLVSNKQEGGVNMEKKVKTAEQTAIEQTIELWEWLAETGLSKPGWPEWIERGGKYKRPRFACFLCEFSGISGFEGLGGVKCQTICPYGKKYGFCANDETPYSKWEDKEEGSAEKKKCAKEFLKQLKALLHPELPIGTKVKNIGEGCAHVDKIGVIVEGDYKAAGGSIWAKYADGDTTFTLPENYVPVPLEVGDQVTVIKDALPEKDKKYYYEGEGKVKEVNSWALHTIAVEFPNAPMTQYSPNELAYVPTLPKEVETAKAPQYIPCRVGITLQKFCEDGRVEVSVDMMEKGKSGTVHRRSQCLHVGDAINIMDDLFIKPPA